MPVRINLFVLFFLLSLCVRGQGEISAMSQPGSFKNIWSKPPEHIPNDVSIDAPLMGNGDITMSLGYNGNRLRY